jgi:hypothetical protein
MNKGDIGMARSELASLVMCSKSVGILQIQCASKVKPILLITSVDFVVRIT